jgi:phosphoglycolate phosphatase-like HAD superfamily hydrolase
MRLVLFDIDGTLLTTAGAAREAFTLALSEAAGRPVAPNGYSFSGRTDPQIARDILSAHGVSGAALEAAIPETIRLYLDHFSRQVRPHDGARLLPGVRELLEALAGRDDVRTALLTGNVERGARIKLGLFGIVGYFDFALSCFGSDDADRNRLPPIALSRARQRIDPAMEGRQLIVVGDSEHDVICSRTVGARSVAVCTGWTPVETLRAQGPDVLIEDFSDTPRAVTAILGAS